MDTEDMYERGVADAERDDLHPFYYQHYYHYRRGYDRTRRRLRRPQIWDGTRSRRNQLLIVALLVVGIGAFVALRSRAQPTSPALTPLASSVARSSTPTATRSPIFPTAIPSPVPPTLHVGGMAQVSNTEGKVLRGRQEPSLKSPAKAAFNEGEQVRIVEGPVEADGYTWWRIESQSGAGWSAQQSQDGVIWLQPLDG